MNVPVFIEDVGQRPLLRLAQAAHQAARPVLLAMDSDSGRAACENAAALSM
jgi:hypothetical protein